MKDLYKEVGLEEDFGLPSDPEAFEFMDCDDAREAYMKVKALLENIRREIRKSRGERKAIRDEIDVKEKLVDTKEDRIEELTRLLAKYVDDWTLCIELSNGEDIIRGRDRHAPRPSRLTCNRVYDLSRKPAENEKRRTLQQIKSLEAEIADLQKELERIKERLADLNRERESNEILLELIKSLIDEHCS